MTRSPQTRVGAHRRQEGLLEAVLCLLAADRRHQEAVDVIAVLVEKHLVVSTSCISTTPVQR